MVKTRIRGERNLIPIWIHKNSNGTDNGIAIPDLPNGLQHRDHLVVSFKWIPVRLMVAKSSVEEPVEPKLFETWSQSRNYLFNNTLQSVWMKKSPH